MRPGQAVADADVLRLHVERLRGIALGGEILRVGRDGGVGRWVCRWGFGCGTVTYYDCSVEILWSALRHEVGHDDVEHVLRNAMVIEKVAEDPTRYLVLGPDRAARLLELVVLDRPQGPAVMHAMPMQAKYRDLLPEGW